MEVSIKPSKKPDKRLVAIFSKDDKKVKTVHFGMKNPKKGTFVDHKDTSIKSAWIARHKVNAKFDNPMSPSSLAKNILWNKETISASIKDYKNKFNLK